MNLPPLIRASEKLRDTIRVSNERLPVTYAEAKAQVDRIQAAMSSPSVPFQASPTKSAAI